MINYLMNKLKGYILKKEIWQGDERTENELLPPVAESPFWHYQSCFDAIQTMRRHSEHQLTSEVGYLTNYLGVKIKVENAPLILKDRGGTIEDIPLPANWHADIAEWAAALRSVDLSGDRFTIVELGCGWGCWMSNTGVAARRIGKQVKLIGIEGDKAHHRLAIQTLKKNGFREEQFEVKLGVAAAFRGRALFPVQNVGGINYGLEPLFLRDGEMLPSKFNRSKFNEVEVIPLPEVLEGAELVDLLHIDIQGGELDLIKGSLATINSKARYLVVGTHSRLIEGELMEIMLKAGWLLEMDRPAIYNLQNCLPILRVDGIQGWRNPRFEHILKPLGSIKVTSLPAVLEVNQIYEISVTLSNTGAEVWHGKGAYPVFLSYHWQNADGSYFVYDGLRSELKNQVVLPGKSVQEVVRVIAPNEKGKFKLILTVVQEGVCWFEDRGFKSLNVMIAVV